MPESPFGYEPSAANTRRIPVAMGVIALFVLVAIGILHVVLHHGVLPHHAQVVDEPGLVPPEPQLQPHPQADIAAERAQKKFLLSQHAWLDSSHDFARIPIARAMQVYTQSHAPDHRPGPAAATSTPETQP